MCDEIKGLLWLLVILIVGGLIFTAIQISHDEALRTAGYTQCDDPNYSGHIWTYKTLNCGVKTPINNK